MITQEEIQQVIKELEKLRDENSDAQCKYNAYQNSINEVKKLLK